MDLSNNILAFGAGEACTLSGIAYKRLDYWSRSGFITPSVIAPEAGNKARRRYSFRNLVELTVARKLRDIGFSLQALRRVHDLLQRDILLHSHKPGLSVMVMTSCTLREGNRDSVPATSFWPMPLAVLDLGRTTQEIAAVALDTGTTADEIRERIACGAGEPQPKRTTAYVG
jgi:DNA-binding transcriptional MerR regulator